MVLTGRTVAHGALPEHSFYIGFEALLHDNAQGVSGLSELWDNDIRDNARKTEGSRTRARSDTPDNLEDHRLAALPPSRTVPQYGSLGKFGSPWMYARG